MTNRKMLFETLWCKGYTPYPEAREILAFFKSRGCRIGAVSDTSPSLELALKEAWLFEDIDSFTASSLVGVVKPERRIYQAALGSLGMTAEESLYADGYDVEAEGAEAVGMTACLLAEQEG